MSQQRRSLVRLGGAWLLALLLLVPVAISGHSHDGAERSTAADSCAACTVAHATFTPAAPVGVAPAFDRADHAAPLRRVDLVLRQGQDDHHGRAPPASSRAAL